MYRVGSKSVAKGGSGRVSRRETENDGGARMHGVGRGRYTEGGRDRFEFAFRLISWINRFVGGCRMVDILIGYDIDCACRSCIRSPRTNRSNRCC